jgi:RimJ/RimL family protein N-acetyltransferase
MAFHRNGLHFREVEEFDLAMLREMRNDPRNTSGWRDPRSVQTIHNQDAWYLTLDNLNQAYVVGDVDKTVGLLRFRLDYPMSEARMTGTDVLPEVTGKGYGRRILRSGAEYVIQELGFHRVTAECLDTNIAAARIIQEAGFRPEGTLRGYIWRAGAWHNWHIFGMLREDLT